MGSTSLAHEAQQQKRIQTFKVEQRNKFGPLGSFRATCKSNTLHLSLHDHYTPFISRSKGHPQFGHSFLSPFPKRERDLCFSAHTKDAALTKPSLTPGWAGCRWSKSRFLLMFFSITTTTTLSATGWGPSRDLSSEKILIGFLGTVWLMWVVFFKWILQLSQGRDWLHSTFISVYAASECLAPRSSLTKDQPIHFIRK